GPLPTLSIANATTPEGNDGVSVLSLTVSLGGPPATQPVTVQYATADGTATAGSDYTPASGTLTFNPGETSKTIVVPILGDTGVESDETFRVVLSNPVNAVFGVAQATVTIQNDDTSSTSACAPHPSVVARATAD